MKANTQLPFKIVLMLLSMLMSFACSKKPAGIPSGSSETINQSKDPIVEEAIHLAESNFNKVWYRKDDSWFSASPRVQYRDPVYFQVRGLSSDYRPYSVSEADKLNGIEWKGDIVYKCKVARGFSVQNGKWDEWKNGEQSWAADYLPIYIIIKKRGKWEIQYGQEFETHIIVREDDLVIPTAEKITELLKME